MGRIYAKVVLVVIALLLLPAFGCAQEMIINRDGLTYVRFDEALSRAGSEKDAYLQIKEYMEKQDKDVTNYYVASYADGDILTVIVKHKHDLLDKNQWEKLGTSRGSMVCEYDKKKKKLLMCLVSS